MTKNLETSKELYRLCAEEPANLEAIKTAYLNGGDVNYSLPGYGFTPLHMAAVCGDKRLIEWLLLHEANPNPYSRNIKTPLDMALSAHLEKEIIDLMVEYGCNKAESKGAYFTKKVKEGVSPFMLDDMCIMKAFCGDGFKLYAAKSDSPTTVNFYGDDEKAPKLIGCVDKNGEIILTEEFSELYFPAREKTYLHEYAYRFGQELKDAVKEIYKDCTFPEEKFERFCDRSPQKARKTAILGDAKATEYNLPVDITLQIATELLCGKMSMEDLLDEIKMNFKLRNAAKEYVGFVNACKARFTGEIEPYEYAIAEAIAPYTYTDILTIYAKGHETGSVCEKLSISVSTDWWENIDRIEKDGRVLYDSRDFEKENIER